MQDEFTWCAKASARVVTGPPIYTAMLHWEGHKYWENLWPISLKRLLQVSLTVLKTSERVKAPVDNLPFKENSPAGETSINCHP